MLCIYKTREEKFVSTTRFRKREDVKATDPFTPSRFGSLARVWMTTSSLRHRRVSVNVTSLSNSVLVAQVKKRTFLSNKSSVGRTVVTV